MTASHIHISNNEADTILLAQTYAAHLRAGDLIALYGDLGTGKSVFCRALIRCLSGQPDLNVPSPTFPLLQTYETPRGEVWHFDLYRLNDPQEIYELGWEEALADGISLIEWPQRIQNLLPPHTKKIEFHDIGKDQRRICAFGFE